LSPLLSSARGKRGIFEADAASQQGAVEERENEGDLPSGEGERQDSDLCSHNQIVRVGDHR
jgi:hypothetical protein